MRLSVLAALGCGLSFFSTTLLAQDLIVVTWGGQTWAVDSTTAAATQIGTTGLMGHNAMGRDDQGRLWITERTGASAATWQYHLDVLDPATGIATQVHTGVADLRGLAGNGTSSMFGIREGGDTLVTVDTATGGVTPIGTIGATGLQGLALHQGTLYGYDIFQGLYTIDPVTGAGTRVDPTSTGNTGIQWICSHSDGRLLGGRDNLYVIDPATGATTLIGLMGMNLDSRGGEQVGGFLSSFGQGCNSPFGTVTLTGSGTPSVNNLLTFTSGPHSANTLAVAVFGLSNTSYNATPLPVSLDPLLGTTGCSLYVSIDAPSIGFTTSPAPATFSSGIFLTPATVGGTFFVQHAVFEPVPGGLATSNALRIFVSP